MTVMITDAGSPLTAEELEKFEAHLQVRLPEEYRRFLLEYNGGRPEPNLFTFQDQEDGSDCHYLLGLNGTDGFDLRPFIETHKDRLPAGLFTIAYDSLGNLICLSTRKEDAGKIYFWDHQTHGKQGQAPTLVAENFETFLNGFKSETQSILEHNFGQESQEEQDEIERIINQKDINALKDLLKEGYDLEAVDDNYLTLLDRVTIAGDLNMVKLVVARGAKVDDALEIARDNAQFDYPGDHKAIIKLLENVQALKKAKPESTH